MEGPGGKKKKKKKIKNHRRMKSRRGKLKKPHLPLDQGLHPPQKIF